jgi:hypothetical protein
MLPPAAAGHRIPEFAEAGPRQTPYGQEEIAAGLARMEG